jgi:hypothetical protein
MFPKYLPALNARFNIARPHLFRHRLNRRHCSADASTKTNAMKEQLMHFERQQVKHIVKLSSIEKQVATVDIKVEKHTVKQVEHAVKLASIGEQVAAVDAKVEKLDKSHHEV